MNPSNKLLVWTAIVIVPFATAVTMLPAARLISASVLALFGVIVLADALFSTGRLASIDLDLPEITRLSMRKPGAIPIQITRQAKRLESIRIGIPLDDSIDSEIDDLRVQLPGDSPAFRAVWPCTPSLRGKYPIDRVYAETASKMGFWCIRKEYSLTSEIRVYPDTMSERKHVASLFLQKGMLGIHQQHQVGKGREFEQLREYMSGDDFNDIHWKSTAKRRYPVTKVYQIERTQEVYVVIDAARLSAREISTDHPSSGPSMMTLLDRYLASALVLGYAAERQGDRFGLASFSDRPENFVRAGNGKAHYNACREAVYLLEPRRVSPDYYALFSFLASQIRKRSLILFLTSLDDPVIADDFLSGVELISRKHHVLVNSIIPSSVRLLFSGDPVSTNDEVYHELGGHLQWQKLIEIKATLAHQGIHLELSGHEELTASIVAQYMSVRQRQLV